MSAKHLAVFIGLLLVLLPECAWCNHKEYMFKYPDYDVGIGPGVGYVSGNNYAVNLDLSLTKYIYTGSVNLKYLSLNGLNLIGPQLELTVWLLMNIGGGVGYLTGDDQGPVYHIFLGIPMGNDNLPRFLEPFETGYIQPYYRLNFFEGEMLHEIGIMLKMNTYVL